ncbi:MAG: response regulator transcription factor [Chloroflexi bacterium]|nr:response regulator transcription factor [Chloroflexota bacterium]
MRVLICDDHALWRDGLRSLLETRGIETVAEARNGREAIELARRHQPDVVLMDLFMPEMDGLSATRELAAELPGIKVVMLTFTEDDAHLVEAIRAGAQGYLIKNLEAEQFFAALEGITRGEPALAPGMARKLLHQVAQPAAVRRPPAHSDLTEREREVLNLLVEGVTSNKELARRLIVTENTVKYHVRNIMEKLRLQTRAQVVAHALRHGLVDGSPAPQLGRMR